MKIINIIIIYLTFFSKSYYSTELNENQDSDEVSSAELFQDNHLNFTHPYGRPLHILKFDEDGNYIVDTDTMDGMFLHPDVKDRKIVAISIIGAYRKGKSFLMDYALRYMYGHYKSISYPNNTLDKMNNWMGEPEESLRGFSWKSGVEGDTNGVIMWSDIFLHQKDNSSYAIILMDTQGLFDTKTSPTDNSRIFSLGTLASSLQIFNLNDVIEETQLEYLQLATEFSKFAMRRDRKVRHKKIFKPFQNLIFLLRDWQNSQESEFGELGGAGYMEKILLIRENQPEALKNVRKYIRNSFEKLYCYLMPHPGSIVTSDPSYDGNKRGLSKDFDEYLKKFLELFFQPSKLVAKKILNKEVTSTEYVEYLKAYFEAFESDEIPQVETLHSITVKKQYEIIVLEAFKDYRSNLKLPNFESASFQQEMIDNGNYSMTEGLKTFKQKMKLGDSDKEKHYASELKNQMNMDFNEWMTGHTKAYENIKRLESEKKTELERLEKDLKNQLEEQIKNSTAEIKLIQTQYAADIKKMEILVNEERDQSEKEITRRQKEFEEKRRLIEEQNARIQQLLQNENLEIKKKALNATEVLERELLVTKTRMETKRQEIEKSYLENKKSRLEELRIETERKKEEYNKRARVEMNRQNAEQERRRLEEETRRKEKKIWKELDEQRQRQIDDLNDELVKTDKKYQMLIAQLAL